MKAFDKRPLSLILCILLGSFVFFTFADKIAKLVIFLIAFITLLILLLAKFISKDKRLKISICASIIIFSSIVSYLYFDMWYYADKRFSEDSVIQGSVTAFDFDGSIKTIDVETDNINEKPFSSYNLKVIITGSDITNITNGTKISFTADIVPFESSPSFDTKIYNYSRGYSASAENVENLVVIGQGSTSIIDEITEYRLSLSRRLILYSSEKSGGLLAALILGERGLLEGQTNLDFSRIGISHVLALSGMNVAMLCYGFSALLSLFGVSKKWRKGAEMLFALLYMTLTGFPVSVMRAGLMLILSSLLFLLSSAGDSITNLFISITLIIIVQPYSIFDISLWLSAFATVGISL